MTDQETKTEAQQPERITEAEALALVNTSQAQKIAQLQHDNAVLRIRLAHGMSDADQIAAGGVIVRPPKPAPTPAPAPSDPVDLDAGPAPEQPGDAPDLETKEG